jgi:hypothetical protein
MKPVIGLLLLLALYLPAQERFDLKVREDFFAGMFGDTARLDAALRQTEEILRRNPRHAAALVWHGSGLITRAANAWTAGRNAEGERLWRQGIREMDRARAIAPNDLGVKIGRSAVLIGMSQAGWDPSDRRARTLLQSAIDDYEIVYAIQSPGLMSLSQHSRCELLFGLAAGWSRLDRAAKAGFYLERILEACRDSTYALEARDYLDAPARRIDHNCIGCHVGKK